MEGGGRNRSSAGGGGGGGGYREENGERNLDSADYRSFVIPGI